jgi:hypothetical protein
MIRSSQTTAELLEETKSELEGTKHVFKKGCPCWGANPRSFDFAYFLIPSLYRCDTAAPLKARNIAKIRSQSYDRYTGVVVG